MPSQGKRSWEPSDDNEKGSSKDYPVCDQCRSRKIRCGRERPHCSNCTRLGLECEWLGQGKKPNRTIWLSHAVTRLGDRLEKLESAVSGLQSSLDTRDSEATPIQTPAPPNVSGTTTPCGRRSSVRSVSGHERYFGPTSLVSLMQDMAAVIQANLCTPEQDDSGVSSHAKAAREDLLQLTEPHDAYRHISDGSILTSPPLVIVEAMIDPYFEMVNPHMPIWTKDGFRGLMALVGKSADASEKRAYDVCANNLVLLTLQSKSLHSRAMSSVPCSEAPATSSIDGDLIRSFIVNAKRALENVELLLLNPSLLSLQALLSLCLVAQTSLSEEVTALLFSFAVHIAKSIGLQQWNSSTHNEGPNQSEFQERRNAMYCMLCLSRAVPWFSGWSSVLPGVATFERELAGSPTDEAASFMGARVTLLRLEEQVYGGLYSDEATRQGTGEIGKIAISRGKKLHQWAVEHSEDLGEDQDYSTPLNCSKHELVIRLNSVQALAAWPISEHAEASRSLLEISRSSLRLFQRLWRATSDKGHYLNLPLLIASYPPVTFFELSRHVLCNPQATDDDFDLVHSFVTMVHAFAEYAEDNSYMKRLSRFGSIILRLANACQESKISPRDGTPPQLPASASTGHAYIQTLEPYPCGLMATAPIYGGESGGSSSESHSNSTPLSGMAQLSHQIPDTEPIPYLDTSTSTVTSSVGYFEGVFEDNLSPLEDLDGWIMHQGHTEPLRISLPTNTMSGFMLQDDNAFAFDTLEL